MSTIKSSDEHLTLNADGSSKDIKFQANGVEKGSLSSAGVMTATSFAGSGANLTNLPSATADGFFATSGLSSKDLGDGLHIKTGDSGLSSVNSNFDQLIVENDTTAGISILTSTTHEGVLAFSDSGGHRGLVRYSHATDAMSFATSDVDRLQITSNGRVVSQSNAHSWVNYNQSGTLSVQDSYNVSSVTDKGTGYAWVNFDTDHGNGSYAVCGMAGNHKRVTQDGAGLATGYVAIYTSQAGQTATTDESRVFVITFGDSA